MTDMEGRIEYVNPHFVVMTGYTADAVMGVSMKELDDVEFHEHSDQESKWRALESGQEWREEAPNRHKSGERYWEERITAPVRDENNRTTNYLILSQNVTQRIRLTTELQASKEQAEAANRAKGFFLANMSHEIRTPMNAIIGMSYLAMVRENNPRQQDYLRKIHQAAHSLLRIINDILDFSKMDMGEVELHEAEFHLDSLFEMLTSQVAIRAQEKGLELLYDVPSELQRFWKGDILRLNQILLNLTGNAIKFTDAGEIVVQVSRHETGLTFEVRDTGIGMHRDQMQRLFHAFTQVDSSNTRRFEGTGLGLAISRQLVELMGGSISVESRFGEGSRFRFSVDLQSGSQEGGSPMLGLGEERHGALILLISPSASLRRMLSHRLQASGLTVSVHGDVDEVSAQPQRFSAWPEPLLCLWDAGGMTSDPTKAIGRLRQVLGLDSLPVLLLLSHRQHQNVSFMPTPIPGVDGVLKPVTDTVLLEGFRNLLDDKGSEADRPRQPPPRPDAAMTHHPLRDGRVLLVEDNEVNRQLAVELLQMVGMEVTVACNGAEAVATVAEQQFDAVLMDVQMPIMDGYEATRIIRRRQGRELPIIAMTANAMPGDREQSLAAGMDDHLSKPVDPERLYSVLGRWLQRSVSAMNLPERPVASEHEWPVWKAIDTATGLLHVSGNLELYRRLLTDFVHNQGASLERLRSLMGAHDQAATREAHTLKGLAGTIGALRLQASAASLEECLGAGRYQEALGLLGPLQNHMAEVLEEIDALPPLTSREEGGEAESVWTSAAALGAWLDRLEPLVLSRQARPCLDLLDQAQHFRLPPEWRQQGDQLALKLRKYRFKEAQGVLLQLRGILRDRFDGSGAATEDPLDLRLRPG
ncbi:MAG: response regulator [Magnetococcales bacterium]|nr:response regulator [Magnetococcales bacterium]